MRKALLVVVLIAAEVVFLAWGLSSNRPRRSSELQALARYEQAATAENESRLRREQDISNREVMLRKAVGYSLAAANLALIIYVLGRKAKAKGG